MKLKYLVQTEDKFLFANCLDDLASYFKLTLIGLRYRMKNDLINIQKINIKLQHLDFNYSIDKNGVVIVVKTDIIDAGQNNQATSALDQKE